MYTNERNRFSLGDIIIKVIFFVLFILLLLYLFPKTSDLKPFYNNVFRENISYMQDAARSYFTTDKLPTEVGKSAKITLKEMIGQNLVLPFVDKDGNSCHAYESYAEVTKEEKGYILKVNLTCGEESDYIVEILGCYDYGCNNDCEGSSSTEKNTALEYEFTKNYTKDIVSYTCPVEYTKDGKTCKKTITDIKVSAKKNYTNSYVQITDAEYSDGKQEKVLVNTIKTVGKDTQEKVNIPYEISFVKGTTSLVSLGVLTSTTGGGTYDCSYTEENCTTYSSDSYPCNCVTSFVGGRYSTSCDTCGGGSYTSCNPVRVSKTCKYPTSTTYSCPQGTTSSTGSGASLQCFKSVSTEDQTLYKCPTDADGSTGNGVNLQCYKLKTVPGKTTYSCPKEADVSEGTGENLKCYKYTNGEKEYYCKDTTATLDSVTHKCSKEVSGKFSHYSCPDDSYKLNGDMCTKTEIDKINVTEHKTTKTYTQTKWSRSKTLWGWTATGRTRIVEVK